MSTKGRVYWGMYFSAQPNSRNYLFLFMLDSSTSSILIPYWIIPPLHLLSNTLSWHRLFHLSWIICITDANMTFKPSTNGFTELAHILKWALPLKGRSWAAHHTYYSQGTDLLFLIKSRLLLLLHDDHPPCLSCYRLIFTFLSPDITYTSHLWVSSCFDQVCSWAFSDHLMFSVLQALGILFSVFLLFCFVFVFLHVRFVFVFELCKILRY